jgi:hypothetical protein
MKLLQSIPVLVFIVWAIGAMPHAAYGEYTYEELKQQVQREQYEVREMQWQQQMDKERAAFDESERIYEESERDIWRQEDHPEIYGQP